MYGGHPDLPFVRELGWGDRAEKLLCPVLGGGLQLCVGR